VLPTTWVIEVGTGEGSAPIFQHPHKVLFLDMLSDEVLGQVRQPEDLVECGAPWARNKNKLKLSSIGYLSETITLTRNDTFPQTSHWE
jgi:hypothetical protein